MITKIIEILGEDSYYNVSENVEVAKGKYKMITSWKEAVEQIKRIRKWQKKSI
jgi:hypothetical protein